MLPPVSLAESAEQTQISPILHEEERTLFILNETIAYISLLQSLAAEEIKVAEEVKVAEVATKEQTVPE